ncbi:hypothetical protein [Aliiroseovarius crassostreae]|uniref:hypothetical protein n=1 Tax=Aliiroseovarius crassostreae TaxID=154981 RepID=UPI00220074F3|nr:hypothetical protein [Aliiroseovarius crassostreae]UWQ05511.1 hypothetical protein K3X22_03395 [Aliiroseovarius crassostreae]
MQFDRPVIDTIPADTPNYELTLKTLQVREAASQSRQWGLGHVISGLRNSVQNSNPTIRAAIQRNVDELAQATGLFFSFSIWDEAFEGNETADILANHLDIDREQMFRAYRHMRNSAAHFYNGRRAMRSQLDYAAFDAQMNGTQPFQSVSFDADSIDISASNVGWSSLDFIHDTATHLFGRFANNR